MVSKKKFSILHYYVGDLHIANRMLRQAEAASSEYDVTLVYRAEQENREHWANGRFRIIFAPRAKQTRSAATLWHITAFLYQELQLFWQLRNLNADIFHPHQHSSLLITCLWLLFIRRPVIFDPHDMYIHDESRRSLQTKIKRWVEKFIVRRSYGVLTVSKGMRDLYHKLYPDKAVYLLTNLPAFTPFAQNGKQNDAPMDPAAPIQLVYAGLIKPERLPLALIEAIGNSVKPIALDILGFSLTDYDQRIMACIEANQFHNISLKGAYKEEDIVERIRPYHYLILPYQIINDNILYCMPNKIYQALAAGLPIIASNMVEISRLVQNHQIGYIYPDGNYAALATILAQLDIIGDEYKEQRRRVSQAAAKMLNYSAYQEELLKAYETALA
jgi:glycosyltransferase involved in cell wall biosynthesis